jgi:hypothetical protein
MRIVSALSGNTRYTVPMMMKKTALLLSCVTLALPLWAGWVWADDDDQYRARAALEAGEILPLAQILRAVSDRVTGKPIEVELERDDGRWIYELEIRTVRGRLVELEVDAATGAIIEFDEDYDDDYEEYD